MSDLRLRTVFDHRIFASQTHGGISRYFAGIAPLMASHGCDARIIAPLHQNAYIGELPSSLVWGWRIPRFRGNRRLAMMLDDTVAAPLARAHGARIVHETYFGPRRLAPRGTAIVLTIYDMIHELFPATMQDPHTSLHKAAAIARADRILCISESTRRDLLHFFPEAEARTSVTLLGFDEQLSGGAEPDVASTRPYLLHVGARGGYKNFSALLDAYARSRRLPLDFDLVSVGTAPFTQNEAEVIAGHGLEHKVRLVQADDAGLNSLYSGAAAFVYPSLYEGFGIPPLEAMSANCPVIGVDRSSVPEVCGGAAEYSSDGSSETLRIAIESVVYSVERTAELRTAGKARLADFSWDRTAAATAACYWELA